MIKRKKQKITSPYGQRGDIFHRGVDLRCYNFTNWIKQPVIFPEDSVVVRTVYQDKWGHTVVVKPVNSEYELKFTHLQKPDLNVKTGYLKGDLIGWTTVTNYMKENGYFEHLHFEVWSQDGHINPEIYFDKIGADYG